MKLITAFVFSLLFTIANSQQDSLNLLKIEDCNNLELKDDSSYDFSFLKDILRDKQYVFLGEREHGDGETLLAKVKMIKYLHEHLGFDVLITEYGIYENFRGWDNITSGRDSAVGVLSCIKYLDCNTIGQDDLYLGRYLQANLNSNELILAGLDINAGTIYGRDFCKKLRSFLESVNYDFDDWKKQKVYVDFCDNYFNIKSFKSNKERDKYYPKTDRSFIQSGGDSLIVYIKDLIKRNPVSVDTIKAKYFIRFIECEKAYDKDNKLQTFNKNFDILKFHSYRDTIMAENLKFLLNERFKDKKVIISTATSHITWNI